MAFWSDATLEPLRQFRWTVIFGGVLPSLDNRVFALKKINKPKAKINTIQHKYLNHFFNYPGRLEWEDINLTFAALPTSAEGLGTAEALLTILANAGYVIPNDYKNPKDFVTISKQNLKTLIGDLTIKNLDPEGNQIEAFKIINPIFTSIDFGAMDYGSEEIIEIPCTVKYDYALFVDNAGNPLSTTPTLT